MYILTTVTTGRRSEKKENGYYSGATRVRYLTFG